MVVIQFEQGQLRPWRNDDVDSLVRHANDPLVARNHRDRFPHPYTPQDAAAWIETATRDGPPSHLAIDVGGEAVGGIGLERLQDVNRRTAEIGYWVGQALWGRGIATGAVRALVDHAFATQDLARIQAIVYEWNPASARVLEKAGFVLEGRLRSSVTKEDRTIDSLLYALVREKRDDESG